MREKTALRLALDPSRVINAWSISLVIRHYFPETTEKIGFIIVNLSNPYERLPWKILLYTADMKPLQLRDIFDKIETVLPEIKMQYHVESIGVFGSFAKNKQTTDSDLDVLVSFTEAPGLITFIELENKLSDLLEIKVDLVMEDALKPKIGERILDELLRLS